LGYFRYHAAALAGVDRHDSGQIGSSIRDRLTHTDDAVRSAQAGDPKALEELLSVHLKDLRAFVRLQLGPELRRREDHSDIVQSACRDILEGLPGFEYRGPGSFRAWLFTAAHNKVREKANFHRAQRRDIRREVEPSREDRVQLYESLCSFEPTASQVAQANELQLKIERTMDRLTDEQRQLLILHRIVGLTHEEISEKLGISSTASRSRMMRASVAFRTALEQLGE
jgi:RNA polymerase sigma-70 factor, ECF subfamily